MIDMVTHVRPAIRKPRRTEAALLIPLVAFGIPLRVLLDLAGESQEGTIGAGGIFAILFAVSVLGLSIRSILTNSIAALSFGLLVVSTALFSTVDSFRVLPQEMDLVTGTFEYPSKIFFGLAVVVALSTAATLPLEQSRRAFRTFFLAFLSAIMVPGGIAILQLFDHFPYRYFDYIDGNWVGRPSGGYLQPNSLSRLWVFAVFFAYMARSAKVISPLMLYAIVALSFAVIFISTHRSSLVFALMVATAFEWRTGRVMLKSFVAFFIVLLLYLVGVLSVLLQSTTARVIALVVTPDGISSRGRAERLERSLDYYASLDPLAQFFGTGFEPFTIDNGYTTALISQGLVGSFLTVAVLGLCVRTVLARSQAKLMAVVPFGIWAAYMLVMNAHTATLLMWLVGVGAYFSYQLVPVAAVPRAK